MKINKIINTLSAILIIASIWIVSCGPSAEEQYYMGLQSEGNSKFEKPKLKLSVNTEGDSCDCYAKFGLQYDIITFQGCEYIHFGYNDGGWGAHSGTCPNPIHNYNPEGN